MVQRLCIAINPTDYHYHDAEYYYATETRERKPNDDILDFAIQCVQDGSYSLKLTKDKRAVRKHATLLSIEKGEVFIKLGTTKVRVVARSDEQRRILKSDTPSLHLVTSE